MKEPPLPEFLCIVSVPVVSFVAFVEAPPCEKVTLRALARLSEPMVSFSVKTTFASVPAGKTAEAAEDFG